MKKNKEIFVFGSNLAGRHGRGAAKYALLNKGAVYGQGEGFQGESYAIPTKDQYLNVRSKIAIKKSVDKFIDFAISNPELKFEITRVGCGLAGYKDNDIGPMFADAPINCILPIEWRKYRNG